MKICIAQIKPVKGDITANVEVHKLFIDFALTYKAEAIFFPELSLTGYEPGLAKELTTNQDDKRLDIFSEISNGNNIIIGLGLPTEADAKARISMIIVEPGKPRTSYSKIQLHPDEFPYFECGLEQIIIEANGTFIAPAICYESLQVDHADFAFRSGANVYIASVAKSANGVEKAIQYYPEIAKQYKMPVFMANCVGFCDNYLCAGKSAVWTKEGKLAGQLDDNTEGILIFDTETEELTKRIINEYC